MAHYRKIDTRIWNDKKFNALSPDGKLVFLFLLTHPNLTVLGAMRMSAMGMAGELQLPFERVEIALNELLANQMVQYEMQALFVWLPHFLKYNPPESPNVVKSWDSAIHYLPEGELKNALMRDAYGLVLQLGKGFQDALPEIFYPCVIAPVSGEMNNLSTLIETHPTTLTQTLPLTPIQTPTVTLPLTPTKTPLVTPPPAPTETPPLITEHRTLSIKQRTVNIKEEEILQENNSEDKNKIEEIKHIVAQKNARQKNAKPPDGEIVDVFRYWQQTMGHPQAQLDEKRRKVIKQALSWGYTVAQLREAILGCSLTPHNRGENEQGQRYDGLHIILRSADQVDRFIRNAHSPPRRRTEADRLLADNLAAGERWLALYNDEEKIIHAID